MTKNEVAGFSTQVASGKISWPVGLLLVLAGCGHSIPHVEQPQDILTPDCLEWAHVQEPLATLGLRALELFGRVDPGLYTMGEGSQGLRWRDGATPPELAPLLDTLNGDPKARDAFVRGYSNALQICGESGCPPTRYPVKVSPLLGQRKSDQISAWTVEGTDFPTALQWRAFRALYASRPELCRVLPSLAIRNRAQGLAQTSGLFTEDEEGDVDALSNPCPCGQGASYGRKPRPCNECGYSADLSAQCTQ
jgi:hypothetical protein